MTIVTFLQISMCLIIDLARTICLDIRFFNLHEPAKLILNLSFVDIIKQIPQSLGARSGFCTAVLINKLVRGTLLGNRLDGDHRNCRTTCYYLGETRKLIVFDLDRRIKARSALRTHI